MRHREQAAQSSNRRLARAGRLSTAVTAFAAMSLPALAQGPGWTSVSTVIELVNTSNGGVNVRLSPDMTGCTSQSGYGSVYASLYPNHPGIDRIKADLLVAFTTGAHVALYLGDNTCTIVETRLYP
jgi:hypothetical protein